MALHRLGLDPGTLQKLRSQGIVQATDILELHPLILLERLDITHELADQLLGIVAEKVAPRPRTARQLYFEAAERQTHLTTGLGRLDGALGGGVPCGTVTELVGPAGVGKSQLCFALTAAALAVSSRTPQQQARKILVFDTEKKFSGERLAQIAASKWQEMRGIESFSRVLVIHPTSPADLLARLKELANAVVEHSVCLVVIDSIAALARAEAGSSLQDRQAMLGRQAALLKNVASEFRIPVVVTNQVTTQHQAAEVAYTGTAVAYSEPAGDELVAALGPLWAHAVNTRLVLENTQNGRCIRVAKSPAAALVAVPFRIGRSGLEELPDEGIDRGGNDPKRSTGIRHDLTYQPRS